MQWRDVDGRPGLEFGVGAVAGEIELIFFIFHTHPVRFARARAIPWQPVPFEHATPLKKQKFFEKRVIKQIFSPFLHKVCIIHLGKKRKLSILSVAR